MIIIPSNANTGMTSSKNRQQKMSSMEGGNCVSWNSFLLGSAFLVSEPFAVAAAILATNPNGACSIASQIRQSKGDNPNPNPNSTYHW